VVEHLVERLYREEPAAAERGRVRTLSPEALEPLTPYRWPGNVRELQNVVFGVLVGKRAGTELLLSDLPRRLLGGREGNRHGVVDVAELERPLDTGRSTFAPRRSAWSASRSSTRSRLPGETRPAQPSCSALLVAADDSGGTVRAMIRRLGLARRRRGRRG